MMMFGVLMVLVPAVANTVPAGMPVLSASGNPQLDGSVAQGREVVTGVVVTEGDELTWLVVVTGGVLV